MQRSEKDSELMRGLPMQGSSSKTSLVSGNTQPMALASTAASAAVNGGYVPPNESLEDHVRKEVAYREEVAKQLQLVRGKY